MTDSTKTPKSAKGKAAAVTKTPDAAPAANKQATGKSEHQFESSDDLEHFIHHNPAFSTLPLDKQEDLRRQLIGMKREEQGGKVLTEADALADLNGTRRPDNHVD